MRPFERSLIAIAGLVNLGRCVPDTC